MKRLVVWLATLALLGGVVAPAVAQVPLVGQREDTTHVSEHVGVQALCVRKDTASALAAADGRYQPCIVGPDGRLYIAPPQSNVQVDADTGGGTQNLTLWGLGVPASGGATSITGRALGSATAVDVSILDASGNLVAPLTDTQLRAAAVPVSGTLAVTQEGAWTVTIGNWTSMPGAYDEDAAHASGEKGHLILGVRNDTLAALTGADGRRSPIATDDTGAVFVTPGKVFTIQGRTASILEFHIAAGDGAQTNKVLVDGGASGVITVTDVLWTCIPDTTATVKWRMGFNPSGTGLPAESLAGAADVFAGGWYKTTGAQGINRAFQGAHRGQPGDDLLLSMDAATGGACKYFVSFLVD